MKRAKHNLTHYRMLTCDMGKMVPISCIPALPGDTFQMSSNVVARVSPLAAPVMHPVTARVHHFFVPNRLVWNKKDFGQGEADDNNGTWEDFITGGKDGNNSSKPPQVTTDAVKGSLQDHLGLPRVAGINVNAMPMRSANLIYNEYYADQDLNTPRLADEHSLPNIAWAKDYFTSARPWAQKGPDVTLPVGGAAPVKGIGKDTQTFPDSNFTAYETGESSQSTFASAAQIGSGADYLHAVEEDPNNPGYPGIFADLSNATGANIGEVRRAFAIQRYQEARSRYGSRYTEYLRFLGVTPSDQRLQRPEYLGGGRTQLQFSEVLQTAPNTGQTPANDYGVGDMYGHGIAAMRSNTFRRFIEEHGYIISIFSVRPHALYLDGIPREFLKDDKLDWYQKELQWIGQQEVYEQEVYADPADTSPYDVFGYQDRYMEYREQQSQVSGDFRDTLDYWHMGRMFSQQPSLNSDFTDCDATKRIHNVASEDALWVMAQNKAVARRMVPRSAYPRVL
ncbi:major capsid protein [Microviridae sp.]|nr:major capsid protein [Microviridae sp.]